MMKRNRLALLAAAGVTALSAMSPGCTAPAIVSSGVPRFAFVANEADNTISAYTIDFASGALTPLADSPFAGPAGPRDAAVCLSGQLLYVVNGGTNGVSGYKIDLDTGRLTQVPGSPFAGGAGPRGIYVDPTGRYVYTANRNDNSISGYQINQATGSLSAIPGSPFAIPPEGESEPGPQRLTIDPSGRFLYVTNHLTGDISGFTINSASGALTLMSGSPFSDEDVPSANIQPYGLVVAPSGQFLFVTNHGTSTLSVYSVSATSGGLTPIEGSPFPIFVDDLECNARPFGISTDPAGQYLFLADNGCDAITVYSIASGTGVPTEISSSPFLLDFGNQNCSAGPNDDSVDGSGKFLYVANMNCSSVAAFSIDAASGSLTQVPGSPFPAGNSPYGVAIARLRLE